MAVRIKEWVIPYKWWVGIEITANHIINVLLRDENNLIQVTDNDELYVDLQLMDGIQPDDDFPVWVTTGKILEEDWWPQSGIILNWKTTSGDYNRWIYANDTHLYFDPWTWVWQRIMTATEIYELLQEIHVQLVYNWKLTIKENWVIKWEFYANQQGDTVVELSGSWIAWNTQTFFLSNRQDLVTAQAAYDRYLLGNEPILVDNDSQYPETFFISEKDSTNNKLVFHSTKFWIRNRPNKWYSELVWWNAEFTIDPLTDQVTAMRVWESTRVPWFLTNDWYNQAFMPTNDSDPASKKYVDDQIASIQPWPTYTAWAGINIDSNNEISNTLPFDPDNQWQVWQVIKKTANWYEWANESWGWTTYYWGTGITIDWNNYINNDWVLTVNGNSPDWNGNIDVTEFDPENAGSTGQVLKKTVNGYEWANESWWWTYYAGTWISIDGNNYISNDWVLTVNGNAPDQNGNINVSWTNYTAWDWISINSSDVISNSKPFDPNNSWSAGQVLKKTSNGYEWANESTWPTYSAGTGINITNNNEIENTAPFSPTAWWSAWQVLTKTANGYEWANVSIPSGENNVKFWNINSASMASGVEEEIMDWVTASPNNWAILNDETTNKRDVYIYDHTTTVWQSTSVVFFWVNRNTEKHTDTSGYDYTVWYQRRLTISTDGSTYSTIVDENPDALTHTNYLSVTTSSGYVSANAFMPTEDYQPATKKYVDTVATWWVSGLIYNDTTGTTSTISKEWVGTQAEYNLITPVNWVIYNII